MREKTVRVGIVGLGNCASSFLQGLTYYRNAPTDVEQAGLMHATIGPYHVHDIEISCAFDVNAGKVGKDVSEAILSAPNNTHIFAQVPHLGVKVERGPTMDGIGMYLRDEIIESEQPVADVTEILRKTHTQVLVSYLPVGSQLATEWYAACALEAGCAFVNCIPVFIASDGDWRRRFEAAGLPLIGDDIKSQVGATIVHRVLANLLHDRGVTLDRTYQLNFGGNADFKNMLERDRLASKKLSKTQSVRSQIEIAPENIHVGPSDHVGWLTDRKWAYLRLEGTGFGGTPINLELKLEVWDSPNSAGVVIDAVRCAQLGLDRGMGGALIAPSSYFMKSPPQQFTDAVARKLILEFLEPQAEEKPNPARARPQKRRRSDHEHPISLGSPRRLLAK